MFLIFDTHELGEVRNRQAITDLGWTQGTTTMRWAYTDLEDGRYALDVEDGDGLTEEELAQCVNVLPE